MTQTNVNAPQGFPTIAQPFVNPDRTIVRPWLQLLLALWTRTGGATGGTAVPPGIVADFAGPASNIPVGWLLCGKDYSRAEYPNLFGAIGTTWGVGDGSTTFGTPPQNIFAKGLGADSVGDTGGADSVTLTLTQMPAHDHPIVDPGHVHTVTDPTHTHTITDPGHSHTADAPDSIVTTGTNAGGITSGSTGTSTTGISIDPASTGVSVDTAMTGVTTSSVGGADPVPTLPPYGTFLKIIKT